MRSLNEWYRYVDRVSRPANRDEDDADTPWRPWLETSEEDGVEPAGEALRADDLPDLSELFTKALEPEPEPVVQEPFRDLTVDIQLPAIPEFSVPDLHVPSFELQAPSWGQVSPSISQALAQAEAEDAEMDRVAEMGVKGGSAGVMSAAEQIKASPNWELLTQIRSEDAGEAGETAEQESSARARFRESRQELIERLVDPTLSLEQTAVILGVCTTTVRRYTNKGLLRHFRTKGNQRRFRLSDVVEFMDSRAAEIEADGRADRAAGLSIPVES